MRAVSVFDNEGGRQWLNGLNRQVEPIWADMGSMVTFRKWVKTKLKWRVECVKHSVEPRGEYIQLLYSP